MWFAFMILNKQEFKEWDKRAKFFYTGYKTRRLIEAVKLMTQELEFIALSEEGKDGVIAAVVLNEVWGPDGQDS